ncbi:hypothetical protein KY290_020230 [Solanum tuberosum]|uniref:Uncharacterized protein n=1 Tax=Solanum tuberosum TaxID=4113 RepID=A0ABQ7UY50_SOLTU|nr:hypothetical protein KY289_022210 [Solanum tuberosum]KAH0692055.1 hypothetical protein KY285_019152 [Solanum tuberosum]KAH0756737.1 hypothetical protein KY290_020230 [Solanum tuberosum]
MDALDQLVVLEELRGSISSLQGRFRVPGCWTCTTGTVLGCFAVEKMKLGRWGHEEWAGFGDAVESEGKLFGGLKKWLLGGLLGCWKLIWPKIEVL